jgi:hypothetical protein
MCLGKTLPEPKLPRHARWGCPLDVTPAPPVSLLSPILNGGRKAVVLASDSGETLPRPGTPPPRPDGWIEKEKRETGAWVELWSGIPGGGVAGWADQMEPAGERNLESACA